MIKGSSPGRPTRIRRRWRAAPGGARPSPPRPAGPAAPPVCGGQRPRRRSGPACRGGPRPERVHASPVHPTGAQFPDRDRVRAHREPVPAQRGDRARRGEPPGRHESTGAQPHARQPPGHRDQPQRCSPGPAFPEAAPVEPGQQPLPRRLSAGETVQDQRVPVLQPLHHPGQHRRGREQLPGSSRRQQQRERHRSTIELSGEGSALLQQLAIQTGQRHHQRHAHAAHCAGRR
jgi:hypothetical protein